MRAMKNTVDNSLYTILQPADLQWQDDGSPFSAQYGDVYFSRHGGLAETNHVFLDANHLQQRWLALDALENPGVFTIVELGFGTGLNFLSCWRLWQQTACKRLRLHFISCEKHPVAQQALTRALQQWPELSKYADALLQHYPDHSPGCHRLLFTPAVTGPQAPVLDLYYGDALQMLRQQAIPQTKVDAWFLDGFSPAVNPELWSEPLLQTIASLCKPGSTLSSYSVTGRVVRALKSLGFNVEKRKGFGPKRQMLFACFAANPNPAGIPFSNTSQQGLRTRHSTAHRAIVIGAGLAGVTVSRSLAQRGIQVTLLEQSAMVAAGASGNRQAVVQLRLNKQADATCQFHIHSYLFALRYYQWLASIAGNGFAWHGCGVLTLNSAYTNTRESADRDTLSSHYSHYPDAILRAVDTQQCQTISGFDLQEEGLWQAKGGWINPRLCCELCADHPLINVVTGTQALSLEKTAQGWLVITNGDTLVADNVIIANSFAAQKFPQTAMYPVFPLRGQVSHVRQTPRSAGLKPVICSQRYLAPADDSGTHCIGASYIKYSEETHLDAAEHEENLQKLGAIADLMKFSRVSPTEGRAGVRGASQDFLPIAGQVADTQQPVQLEANTQRRFAKRTGKDNTVNLIEGLYISTGHGSHGTVSCPLIAEHIAALICNEPSPLPQSLADVIDPARFIRRQRRRGSDPVVKE